MDTSFAAKWESMLSNQGEPIYLRNIVRYGCSAFLENVKAPAAEFIQELAESIYSGDLLVLEGALSNSDIHHVRKQVVKFGNAVPAGGQPLLDGCPNFHEINDGSGTFPGGYFEFDHSHYFFRWNGDDLGLFDRLDPVWAAAKVLGGLKPDEYVNNLPSDSYIDRIDVIHYPAGGGELSTHGDPSACNKITVGVYLTSFGQQYKQGGFYMLESGGKRRMIDPEIKEGDVLFWFPGIAHGVEAVDPDLPLDWNGVEGRWFVSLASIQSHHVKDRLKTWRMED